MFVDHIRVHARAGNGGNGSVHFFRGKFNPKGGPDGGDGGDGGDVILEVSPHVDNLKAFFYDPKLFAEDGRPGEGYQRSGKAGEDKIFRVPPGTLVCKSNAETLAEAHQRFKEGDPDLVVEQIADLREIGEHYVLANGGRGGKGNDRYKTSTNQAPEEAQPGTPGEEGIYFLEMRMIADIGLVGFPNAGKSTLVSQVSAAAPKIGAYPFTTLQPMIGVIDYPGYARATIADIPGLIEGAHENVGLGHEFLRHITRCGILLFVVDAASTEGRDPIEDLQKLRTEVKLYNEDLASQPWMIVANKLDLEESEEHIANIKMRFPKKEVFAISARDNDGIDELKKRLGELVARKAK